MEMGRIKNRAREINYFKSRCKSICNTSIKRIPIDKYDIVLELSIANEDEVWTILDKLCFSEEQEEEKILNKWIFAIIYYVYTYDRDRVFEIIGETYVEFNYFRQIENLIPYMPCEDGRTMEERLEKFIRDGKEMYSK